MAERTLAADLLLADLESFEQSLARNEELGEKRFNFFLTLCTAAGAGIITLYTSDKVAVPPARVREVIRWLLVVLLGFGVFTYLRMLQRNRLTDDHKKTLRYIRNRLALADPELTTYSVPIKRTAGSKVEKILSKYFRAGYAETTAAMVGVTAAANFVMSPNINPFPAALLGTVIGAGLWLIGAQRADHKTNRKKRSSESAGANAKAPNQFFRAGVGALILNGRMEALTIERREPTGTWQLPQGGLDRDEMPHDAVLREILEETGIPKQFLVPVLVVPEPMFYELPVEKWSSKNGRGQVHYWFVFRYIGNDSQVDISESDEAAGWGWMPLDQLLLVTAPFRVAVYRRLQAYVSEHLPGAKRSDPAAASAGAGAPRTV